MAEYDGLLARAEADAAVFALRPDYRALLVTADGIVPGASDEASDALLRTAERQARQTQLTDETTTALFILDALDPMTDAAIHAAADDLTDHLAGLGADVRIERRLIAEDGASGAGPGTGGEP